MERRGGAWVMILAGGDGTRVRELARDALGHHCPKQFCRFGADRSLLGLTLERARRLAPPERILALVAESQRHWWEAELVSLPPKNVLSQPTNKGTAVAILRGLLEILARDPDAVVIVLPSDHGVADPESLATWLERAARIAGEHPQHLVLLGIEPDDVDPEYGWIVPQPGEGPVRGVASFVEKPAAETAARLARSGALISSFMMAATAGSLRDLYAALLPDLLARFAAEPRRWRAGYDGLAARDFSRDLLQECKPRLRVLRMPPCGWSDLGTPARLHRWLAQSQAHLVPAG